MENQRFLVVRALWRRAEYALQRIVTGGALDELESPRCPETFHGCSVPVRRRDR